jgi:hypothetical protein
MTGSVRAWLWPMHLGRRWMSLSKGLSLGCLRRRRPFGLGDLHALARARAYEISFELDGYGQHVEPQPPDRVGRAVARPAEVEPDLAASVETRAWPKTSSDTDRSVSHKPDVVRHFSGRALRDACIRSAGWRFHGAVMSGSAFDLRHGGEGGGDFVAGTSAGRVPSGAAGGCACLCHRARARSWRLPILGFTQRR